MFTASDPLFGKVTIWDIREIIEDLGHVPDRREMVAWVRRKKHY